MHLFVPIRHIWLIGEYASRTEEWGEPAACRPRGSRDVDAILEAHYLGGRLELAEQAIVKLNAQYGLGTEIATGTQTDRSVPPSSTAKCWWAHQDSNLGPAD